MIPAWSLGVILLGNVFGFPVPFNSTHNGTRQHEYETLPQLNDTVGNSTQPFMSNDTESNETEIPFPFPGSVSFCYLPTCMTSNLGSALQTGEEIAGSSTKDPLMQSWNETYNNSTLPRDPPPLMYIRKIPFPVGGAIHGCKVSLCALNNLGHALNQGGDERAGGATRDPHGNGKR